MEIKNYTIFSFHKETEQNKIYGTLLINDKNNLIVYNGKFNIFYLYNPIFLFLILKNIEND